MNMSARAGYEKSGENLSISLDNHRSHSASILVFAWGTHEAVIKLILLLWAHELMSSFLKMLLNRRDYMSFHVILQKWIL